MVRVRGGKGRSPLGIHAGEDVSLHPVNEPDNRIHLQHPIAVGTPKLLSPHGWPFDEGSRSPRKREADRRPEATALPEISEDAADRGGGYCVSALGKENGDLVLAKTGMILAERDDALGQSVRYGPLSPALRRRGDGIETFELATRFLESPLPAILGATRYPECFLRRIVPMPLPEGEDTGAALGVFGDHIPEAYLPLPPGYESSRTPELVENVHALFSYEECQMYLNLCSRAGLDIQVLHGFGVGLNPAPNSEWNGSFAEANARYRLRLAVPFAEAVPRIGAGQVNFFRSICRDF